MKILHCNRIEITEWYDGLVQGMIYHPQGIFYAILLAWNVDLGKRLYLIVPLDQNNEMLISAAYCNPDSWPSAHKLIITRIRHNQCYFSQEMPTKGLDLHLSVAPSLSQADFQLERFIIDQAVSEEAIEKWLK